MKKSLLIILIFIYLAEAYSSPAHAEVLSVCKTETGSGWLERSDHGDLILHLEGSYYDMGYQHGMLLKKETELVVRSARYSVHRKYPFLPFSLIVSLIHEYVYEKQAPYIPPEFAEEMKGLADASGVSLKEIQALHSATYLTSCAGAVAWGPASADGQLYFSRSNDIAVAIDPVTRKSYHDNGMMVIYKPRNGIPYMIVSWPGYIGASDGMNAEGIAVGNMSDPSKYETPAGLPMCFRLKQALAKSHNLNEAIEWMTGKPFEGGYNFLVADAKIPSAVAIEMDARTIYVGGWDGPAESNKYTYRGRQYVYVPKEGLLTRTNHPLSTELITNHEVKIDRKYSDNTITARRYVDLRARLVNSYGLLDLDLMNEILRAHYQAMNYKAGPTFSATSHQFVFAPKSGDILIAFCHGNPLEDGRRKVSAFNQPFHRYNFFELLNGKKE